MNFTLCSLIPFTTLCLYLPSTFAIFPHNRVKKYSFGSYSVLRGIPLCPQFLCLQMLIAITYWSCLLYQYWTQKGTPLVYSFLPCAMEILWVWICRTCTPEVHWWGRCWGGPIKSIWAHQFATFPAFMPSGPAYQHPSPKSPKPGPALPCCPGKVGSLFSQV